MKCIVRKDILKEVLGAVERIVSSSHSLLILKNILLRVEKNILKVSSTDLEIGMRYSVLVQGEKEGSIAVPARQFSQFVSFLSDGPVTLETRNTVLDVISQDSHTQIKGFSSQDFPIIPSLHGDEKGTEIENPVYIQGLRQVVGMTGKSQARPEISGVFFMCEGKELRLVSTDSFRLAEKLFRVRQAVEKPFSFILPQRTAQELIHIFGDRPGTSTLYLSSSQLIADYKANDSPSQTHIQLVSRLIEGEYPNYQEVIPTKFVATAVLPRQQLLNQLRGVGVFAGKMNEVHILISPERKGVELTAQTGELGESASFTEGDITGKETEASFNWRFFAEGLAQFSGEQIEFSMNSAEGPTLLREPQREGYLYVVMPIRA